MNEVYLDYNACAPVRPEAARAVIEALGENLGNPASVHAAGHRAKVVLEMSRRRVAALLGALPEEICFTSGGTEANNLALRGAAALRKEGHLLVTAIEHSSVLESAKELEVRGFHVTRVLPDAEGWVDPETLLAQVRPETLLVSLMHSSHEVGTLQSVQAVAEGLKGRGILFHCDAVQSAGKVAIDVRRLGPDLVSLSAHKLGAPAGAGALWMREGVTLAPLLRGGNQEMNRRAGTPPLSLIAGFGAAAEISRRELSDEEPRLRRLRDRLEADLTAAFPEIRIHGRGRARLPGTCHFALPGTRGEDLMMALDLEGIAVSTGSACATGTVRPSHVLQAMGCGADEVDASLRVSLGYRTTQDEIARFLETFQRVVRRSAQTTARAGR